MDYRRALDYQLDDPQWTTTLLFVTLALLVPLIGPVVALGYEGSVIAAVAATGNAAPPPRFDFECLSEYLLRGVRMFVVSLVLAFVLVPVIWLLFALIIGGGIGAASIFGARDQASTLFGCLATAVGVVGFCSVMLVAGILITPLMVRAALDPDLAGLFDLGYVRDFIARTGRDGLTAHLFLIALNLGLVLVGLLACLVGVFPALAFGALVRAHVFGQLHRLYLERGGRRVAPP